MNERDLIYEDTLSNSYNQRIINYLLWLDENREEILMDFFIKYTVLINNMSRASPPVNIDGRFINKTFLKFCDDLGIVLPISLGSDPVYNSLLFSKFGELEEVCGFHPGIELHHSISVDKNTSSKFSEVIGKTEKDVHSILQYHFGNYMGVKRPKEIIQDMVWGRTKPEIDQFARYTVDMKMVGEFLVNMKLDYVNQRINEKIHLINPNTKNIIEEIDAILSGESEREYIDCVDLERELKDIFRNYKRKSFSRKKRKGIAVGDSHHGPSCEMNNGNYEYFLNHEYLEAIKDQNGKGKIITYKGKEYLIFRGTCMRSFLGVRLDHREEYRFSHVHYYFLEIEVENRDKIVRKLEKYLHGVVAKRFLIDSSIRSKIEANEKEILKKRYIKHYELVKELMNELEDVNFDSIHCDPLPAYGGLILATFCISSRPNIPMGREQIQSYLAQIEIETLLSLGNSENIEVIHSFENGLSFRNLYRRLCTLYLEGKHITERLKYLEMGLRELLPVGYISENTRPLQLKTLLKGKKSNCEGYVLLIGVLLHLWQNIFPELLGTDIRLYLFPHQTLDGVLRETKFREPHMFVAIKINGELEVIDPTNMILNRMIKENRMFKKLLQEHGYWKSYRIRKIEESDHDY